MAEIVLDQVGRVFGATRAVDSVTLTVPEGDFLVLLGPSGCGKSTLLRMVAGLLPPSSGRIVIDGRDVTALPPGERDIAMVFQSYALYPHLSVESNLAFGLRVRRHPRGEISSKVNSVAQQLQLTDLLRRKPRALSGGQRQRVALGRAMVRDPKAFLMDEPLSNLDAQLRTATRLELSELHRRLGTTFVYVTHDQVEAMTMATRIAVLNRGRLEQVGTPAEVYDRPATTFVAGFVGAPPMNLLPARAVSIDGRVHVLAEGVDIALWEGTLPERAVVLGVRPEHLHLAPAADSRPAALTGTIRAIENLGSEEIGFCDVGGRPLALRGPRPLGAAVGSRVGLTASVTHIHLFDPQSTRRLEWAADGSTTRTAPAVPRPAARV